MDNKCGFRFKVNQIILVKQLGKQSVLIPSLITEIRKTHRVAYVIPLGNDTGFWIEFHKMEHYKDDAFA